VKKAQAKEKEQEFKPVSRVIVPTVVRFDIPIPEDVPGTARVAYAQNRVEKIIKTLNKSKKLGVRAEAEFLKQHPR